MPVAAIASPVSEAVLTGRAQPISAKAPTAHVSAVAAATENPVPLEVSSPLLDAQRHPVPALRDRTWIRPASTTPVPDGRVVVGADSVPVRTRTYQVRRRGPVPLPKLPPPPETDSMSSPPDGGDGTGSVGCRETSCSSASRPDVAPAGKAGVMVVVPWDSAPAATYEMLTAGVPPLPGRRPGRCPP